jgi:streptogramin lyase
MLILSPSAASGPLAVTGAPVPIAASSTLVNQLSVKPRLGQWSKVLIGGPNLGTDESNAMAILYPVPNGGQADAFVVQDQGGQNTIDLSQIYVYATIPGDTPMVEAFGYQTV